MNWKQLVGVAAFGALFVGCGDDVTPNPCDENPTAAECIVDPCADDPSAEGCDIVPDEVTVIPETCNGNAAYCTRRYDQMVFPGTHNSMSVAEEGWSIPNQNRSMKRQLEDGIRVMLFDVHKKGKNDPGLMLCHSLCLLGSRPLADGLRDIRNFLLTNRGEVLTLIIQNEVPADDVMATFKEVGLDRWAYVFDGEEYPTMAAMIEANTRLVITFERGAPADNWGANVWDVAFDNSYTYASLEEMATCGTNRGSATNGLFLMNHWIGPSQANSSAIANTYDALMDHAEVCIDTHARMPNFVAVDHYDLGDLFDVVEELNSRFVD